MKISPACVVLIIADGWGLSPLQEGNAIALAKTPVVDRLLREYPQTALTASGLAVGLPAGQMGNSEVGHLNIGAGRVVYQELTRISKAIADGDFERNQVLLQAMGAVKKAGGTLHLMGLLSDGGVHSHLDHLQALVSMAAAQGTTIAVHAFLDGRDTPPTSGKDYLEKLQTYLAKGGNGSIATVMGRFYAMDRDQRWDRVAQAYDALVCGQGRRADDALSAIESAYGSGEVDEFVLPTVIVDHQGQPTVINDGDGIIFFNFRADRAREITRALTSPSFSEFARRRVPKLGSYVCFTEYDASFDLPVAFPPESLTNVLGEVIAAAGLRQLHIAETEKYAHVTFFFNGGREEPFPGEDRCLIPSPRDVRTYDEKPAMSAFEVAAETLKRLESGRYQLIVLNFANCDMVGHTGGIKAAVLACEAVDTCIGKVVDKVLEMDGVALLTADHGNAEQMVDGTGRPQTAHSTNPVPCVLVGRQSSDLSLRTDGVLADIAPTILDLLGIECPDEMTGRSLLAC
ncbi:MAG: 2,3-bisphosphoglycerate-independent phosphoglycerate mutase [Deltaproteobacteria bacterium]|nr:2,3-bisphosphoglycerate-independent phosphoglycerate mutase [Candidatus Anaeroferrophillus wilburensis]MBN2889242.1 2,3-bisphosphoglycerate-independent phosphoglycerate mutase [Deltaproteobacteria bacterium]